MEMQQQKKGHHSLLIQQLAIGQIQLNPNNPRIHKPRQINALAKSITTFGFNIPIATDNNDMIIAGHARLEAAKKLGMTEVPVIRLDHLTPEQARAFMIADNRLSELSTWDEHSLAVHLKELSVLNLDFDLESTGFTIGEIDLRIEGLDMVDDEDDEEYLIPPTGPAICHPEQLWQLEKHRMLCGNAQEAKSFERLMDGRLAGMVISDPPYNVRIDGHVGGKGKIKHREFAMAAGEMSEAEFTRFLQTTFGHLVTFSAKGSVHTLFMDWRHLSEILAAGKACYTNMLNLCIWVKNQAGMGSLYRSQHELALIYRNGNTTHQNNVQLGRFGRHRSNVWQYPGIQSMRHGEEGDLLAMHPTVKPVKMIADAILDCSKRGDIILDPFLGSGTALMAAERTGRVCYGMELDPLYVDTAIRRWQTITGQEAICAETGETFSSMESLVLQSNVTAKRRKEVSRG